jgi:L-lactate dehydrogenase complex protein LldF
VGISGVNFGVAETGSLCIVTNEGNGRMVTTLPAVHIALMGIERLVPTLDDLALMLRLLPRSATGQKLTVYTSLIQAPRRPAEADGPVERHVILIDNGRRQMRGSPLREGLYCIRCGACLNACPVFREIGGHVYQGISGKNTPYPGPIGSVISPGLFGQPEFSHLARASSLCGACKEACPVDIDLPKLLLRVRAGMAGSSVDVVPGHAPQPTSAPKSLKLGLRMFTWAAASPRRYHAAQRLAGWISRAASPGTDWLKLPARTGWGTSRDFPRPAMQSFSAWVKKNPVKHTGQRVAEETLSTEKDSPSLQPPSGGLTPPEADGSDLACAPQSTPEARLRRFESELSTLGGSVSRCQRAELAGTILDWLEAHHTTRMLAWEQAHLPDGLLDALLKNGIQIGHTPDADAQVGLTGALAGIAETGTLALPAGGGRPQSASLLPEYHLAILRIEDIYDSLEQVLKLPKIWQAANGVLVSGPSRTADIEMTLTIGVHGPRVVHVVCLMD